MVSNAMLAYASPMKKKVSSGPNGHTGRWLAAASGAILTAAVAVAWRADAPPERGPNIEVTESGKANVQHMEAHATVPTAVGSAPQSTLSAAPSPAPRLNGGNRSNQDAQKQAARRGRGLSQLPRLRPAQVERLGRILELDHEGMERLRSLNRAADEAVDPSRVVTSATDQRTALAARFAELGDIVRTSPAYRENPKAFEQRPLVRFLLTADVSAPTAGVSE